MFRHLQDSPDVRSPARGPDRSFNVYCCARSLSELASQIGAVAVGWQVYALTKSAFDLGLVGLAQFLPTLILTLAAGHAADRLDRRRLVQACQAVKALIATVLACGAAGGWLNVGGIFTAAAMLGAADAFEAPAAAAMLSAVTSEARLQRATALVAGTFQGAAIAGPALGGLIYGIRPGAPYAVMAALWLATACLNGAMSLLRPSSVEAAPAVSSVLAGVAFVWRSPTILGTISLDLVAVLLGGATTLLPIFARDILHAGPFGLGLLRSAPALGAVAMAAALTRWPIARRTGLRMFQAVIVFGLATILFALSHSILLSVIALIALGAADMVSVVIRSALLQVATPDALRGRVGAVNSLFVGGSYQLGGFESGVTAAFLGAAPAALLGGIGTVALALLWMRLFPTLRTIGRVESAT